MTAEQMFRDWQPDVALQFNPLFMFQKEKFPSNLASEKNGKVGGLSTGQGTERNEV